MSLLKYYQEAYIDPELQTNPQLVNSLSKASPVHTHDFFEFFLIIKGSCLHQVNGKEQYLDKGALVFIRPSDVHSYSYYGKEDCQFINIPCRTEIITATSIYLGGSFSISKLLESDLPWVTLLTPNATDNFILRYEKLIMLSTIDKFQSKLNLMNLIVEILVQHFSSLQLDEKKVLPLWYESLLTKMQKKENFTEGLSKMHEISGRSIGHLNRVFKQYLNSTPTEYINNLRLNYAKGLLITTNLSGTDICLEAGFGNLSHFYHVFKQNFKMSPLDFRSKSKQSKPL